MSSGDNTAPMSAEAPAMMTPQERYERDAHFRSLVDLLTEQIIACEYSPTELREAVMLAAIRYEMIHARPTFVSSAQGEAWRRTDSYHGKEGRDPLIPRPM